MDTLNSSDMAEVYKGEFEALVEYIYSSALPHSQANKPDQVHHQYGTHSAAFKMTSLPAFTLDLSGVPAMGAEAERILAPYAQRHTWVILEVVVEICSIYTYLGSSAY